MIRSAPLRAMSVSPAVRMASAPKHDAIRDAARRVFLREGYSASMDLVAAEAGVSKQTVYNHFGSKEGLFRAIVDHVSGELLDVLVERDGTRADPAATLEAVARRFLKLLLLPAHLALHRMLVAEAPRFPDLARPSSSSARCAVISTFEPCSARAMRRAMPRSSGRSPTRCAVFCAPRLHPERYAQP